VGCVLILNGGWIGLYHFRSLGNDSYYLDHEHSTMSCPRSEWGSWSVETVEECWNNCLRLYNRLYLVSEEFKTMWNVAVWSALRQLKVHKARYFPGLSYGPIVYEILDNLAHNLFLMIGRHDVTPEQLSNAMQRCRVSESDPSFILMYNQLEKEYDRSKRSVVLDTGNDGENPSKRQRLEKEKEKDKEKKKEKKKEKEKEKRKVDNPCFKFLSQAGCSKSDCHFSHKTATEFPADKKTRFRDQMATRGMVVDESKF
jgi:hypothetical protein